MKSLYPKIVLGFFLSLFVFTVSAQYRFPYKHKFGKKGRNIEMPKFDKKHLQKEDSINEIYKVGGMRFAQKFEVNLTPDNAGESFINADGSKLWLLDLKSDSAFSINIHFSKFKLLAGDTVYIYNKDKSKIVGPLTAKDNMQSGQLPIAPIDGDAITVELRQSALVSTQRALQIASVNHDYRGFRTLPQQLGQSADDCSLHASCVPEINALKQSVCLLILDGSELCTGTLVNNTAKNNKPYILTAAHCFGSSVSYSTAAAVAPSIIAFFNYEAPLCKSAVRGNIEQTVGGSVLRAYAKDIDFALIELSSLPPVDYRPYFAGWNKADIPTAPFIGVHHPWGTVKRYIKEDHALVATSYGSPMLADSHWRVRHWEVGTTEAGSSGSPLFDSQQRLVGALTGGSSYCSTPNDDYYYRLNKAWAKYAYDSLQLKAWLDPLDLGKDTLSGLNPYGKDSALRYTHITSSESVQKSYFSASYTGMISGQNSALANEYAEKFSLNENAYLYGVFIMPAKANADASNLSPNDITIRVYAGDGVPELNNLLDYKTINLKSLQWNGSSFVSSNKSVLASNENYIRFETPIAVGKDFFISYDVPYTNLPTDSFCVYTAAARSTGGLETAYAKFGGSWLSMYDFAGQRTSLWIDPVLRYDSTAIALDTSLVSRSNQTVVFPNPAKDYIRVMTRNDQAGVCTIKMYNYLGQHILTETGKVLYPAITIDLNGIATGVYYLRVEYENKAETHKIIVIQ